MRVDRSHEVPSGRPRKTKVTRVEESRREKSRTSSRSSAGTGLRFRLPRRVFGEQARRLDLCIGRRWSHVRCGLAKRRATGSACQNGNQYRLEGDGSRLSARAEWKREDACRPRAGRFPRCGYQSRSRRRAEIKATSLGVDTRTLPSLEELLVSAALLMC